MDEGLNDIESVSVCMCEKSLTSVLTLHQFHALPQTFGFLISLCNCQNSCMVFYQLRNSQIVPFGLVLFTIVLYGPV